MATFNVSVDTEKNTLEVSLNGSVLKNVSGINVYRSCRENDEYYIQISTETKDDSGVRTCTTHMMECEVEEGAMASGKVIASEIPGFVKKSELNSIHLQIHEWLKK